MGDRGQLRSRGGLEGRENKSQWLELQIIWKSYIKTLLIVVNCNHQSRLNKMIMSYEDTRLSLDTRVDDCGPQGHVEPDAIKAPSLSGLLSAPFTLTSPGTPMCLLLGWQDGKYGNQQFQTPHTTVWSSEESLNWLDPKFLMRDPGQAASYCWEQWVVTWPASHTRTTWLEGCPRTPAYKWGAQQTID